MDREMQGEVDDEMQNAECRMQARASTPRAFSIRHLAFAFCTCHFAVLAFLLPTLSLSASPEIIDRVLAVAAGDVIMLSDVTAARDLGLVALDKVGDPIGVVLSKLIDRALVLAEVDRYAPPEPGSEAVDREVLDVRARLASPQAFDAALQRSGIDEHHLRQTLREDLRIVAYEAQRFTVAPPTDEEVARYYREHPELFTRQGRPTPFDSARPDVARTLTDARRNALIAEWVAGLRRRGDVIDLYVGGVSAR